MKKETTPANPNNLRTVKPYYTSSSPTGATGWNLRGRLYALFVIISFAFIFYHLIFAGRVIPGVKVGNLNLGGKTASELKEVLTHEFAAKTADGVGVIYSYNGSSYTINSEDIGLKYDVEETIDRLFYLGRTGNIYVDSKDKLAALIKGIKVVPVYSYDDGALDARILGFKGSVNVQTANPEFIWQENGTLGVSPSGKGLRIVDNQIRSQVFLAFNNLQKGVYSLPVVETAPEYSVDDLLALKPRAQALVNNPPVVKWEKKEWRVSSQRMVDFLSYTTDQDHLELALDKIEFTKFADEIGKDLEIEPRGEVQVLDGRVTSFKITVDGKTLDDEKLRKEFSKYIEGVSNEHIFSASQKSLGAFGKEKDFGIYAQIGEGISYYHGSIPGRIKNLNLAAKNSSGVLVAPGGTYSFNKAVGEVSYKAGYDPAYIIENGRTVLGEGGGVCQASTTVFRAALNAGLPITRRTAHAYRVHYYEEKSEPGFDATVYAPSVDLQFKNDTPNYILVQADGDPSVLMSRVRIFGTPDGRKVEITKPVITNPIPPLETRYEDDPTLPKGQTKQVEWASWGSTVTFERKVTKNEEILYQDKFVSRYQPWPNIFKKGTKE